MPSFSASSLHLRAQHFGLSNWTFLFFLRRHFASHPRNILKPCGSQMEWGNLTWLVWHSQLTTTSSPLPIHICQFTAAKLPQDNSTGLTHHRDNSLQAVKRRAGWAGEWTGGQSAEWYQWSGASHFHIPWYHHCQNQGQKVLVLGRVGEEGVMAGSLKMTHHLATTAAPTLPTIIANVSSLFSPELAASVKEYENGKPPQLPPPLCTLLTHSCTWLGLPPDTHSKLSPQWVGPVELSCSDLVVS